MLPERCARQDVIDLIASVGGADEARGLPQR
jgi:hypothetical protein